MNRERGLTGTNGYERELKLEILPYLRERCSKRPVRWLDACCGTGRALVEAASEIARAGESEQIEIAGLDLAGLFVPNPFPRILMLRETSLEA